MAPFEGADRRREDASGAWLPIADAVDVAGGDVEMFGWAGKFDVADCFMPPAQAGVIARQFSKPPSGSAQRVDAHAASAIITFGRRYRCGRPCRRSGRSSTPTRSEPIASRLTSSATCRHVVKVVDWPASRRRVKLELAFIDRRTSRSRRVRLLDVPTAARSLSIGIAGAGINAIAPSSHRLRWLNKGKSIDHDAPACSAARGHRHGAQLRSASWISRVAASMSAR